MVVAGLPSLAQTGGESMCYPRRMAILIEAASVVVRNSVLEEKYPGGRAGFERDAPNETYCADEHLSRVAFMVPADAERFAAELETMGLSPFRADEAGDVALVSCESGFVLPCVWLELGEADTLAIAWLAGTEQGDLHVPENWSRERQLLYLTDNEVRERMEWVRTEGNLEVYRDKQTGEESYVARVGPMDVDVAQHDQLYSEACELIKGRLVLGNDSPDDVDAESQRRLERATALFTEVTRINPANWAALWLLGKIEQRLGDYERALMWFARAHRVHPRHPDVAREAAIAAMELGLAERAIPYCERAIESKPDDPGLRANLGLALLLSGRPAEARGVLDDVLARDPEDAITHRLLAVVDDVLAGTRTCPSHVREI